MVVKQYSDDFVGELNICMEPLSEVVRRLSELRSRKIGNFFKTVQKSLTN